jgi:hypothetical protein
MGTKSSMFSRKVSGCAGNGKEAAGAFTRSVIPRWGRGATGIRRMADVPDTPKLASPGAQRHATMTRRLLFEEKYWFWEADYGRPVQESPGRAGCS